MDSRSTIRSVRRLLELEADDGLRVVRIAAPAPCPSIVLGASGSDDRPFALISGRGDPGLSRWSYAGLEPVAQASDVAEARRQIAGWAQRSPGDARALPPFVGGAIGYVGYDLGWRFLMRPRRPRPDPLGMPAARFYAYDAIYARSEETREGFVIAQPTRDAARRARRLTSIVERGTGHALTGALVRGRLEPAVARAVHVERIREALELIAAGEIYQVNLTYPRVGSYRGAPEAAFLRLLAAPPPFAGFLRIDGEASILSASPECFFDYDASSGRIAVYPIKGTRGRSNEPGEDHALAVELARNEKERAEHLMIVDLLRNDLGRLATVGSVSVRRLAYVESFPRVHHLTSAIEARLSTGPAVERVLEALFPGGSITGVPKQRAMEVIDALEDGPRGVYTGAFGYLSPDGSARTSIAIRTAQLARGEVRLGVGGGIVADSVPDREWDETELKASALSRALADED